MLAVGAASLVLASRARASLVLAVALVAVLLLDPWAVLAPGFWLSFGAVAALITVSAGRIGQPGWLAAAVLAQAAVTVALWPVLAVLFGEASLVSPLANAVAIPIVSLVVVPLSMLGCLPGLEWALAGADAALALLMTMLRPLAALPWAVVENPSPPIASAALALAGAALLLLPRGVPLRWVGIVLALPLALHRPPTPSPGEAWVDVLDVGQGLAVIVRTATRALAYDTGPSWGPDSDAGERIVVPFLRGEGVRRLDGLVVTHADDDHLGGAFSVAIARRPGWILSPLDWEDPLHALSPLSLPCRAPGDWEWDDVRFAVLHPGATGEWESPLKENNRSCVIRVATPGGSMLLTGDIERRAEAALVRKQGGLLQSAVLLVPHHGSKTSSTDAFLGSVQPKDAIVSAGWANRFRHPAADVVRRYEGRGIALHRTDLSGALRVVLPASPAEEARVELLVTRRRYWSERVP
jgi:competence protein ComEC